MNHKTITCFVSMPFVVFTLMKYVPAPKLRFETKRLFCCKDNHFQQFNKKNHP